MQQKSTNEEAATLSSINVKIVDRADSSHTRVPTYLGD